LREREALPILNHDGPPPHAPSACGPLATTPRPLADRRRRRCRDDPDSTWLSAPAAATGQRDRVRDGRHGSLDGLELRTETERSRRWAPSPVEGDQPVQQDEDHHQGQHDAQHAPPRRSRRPSRDEAIDAGATRWATGSRPRQRPRHDRPSGSPAGARGEARGHARTAEADATPAMMKAT